MMLLIQFATRNSSVCMFIAMNSLLVFIITYSFIVEGIRRERPRQKRAYRVVHDRPRSGIPEQGSRAISTVGWLD